MSDNITYELQTYLGGVWKIDSVYDDRQIAVFEAQRINAGGRVSAVRVVAEIYDDNVGRMVSKTVFRAAKADEDNADAMERQKSARREVAQARKAAGTGEYRKKTTSPANESGPSPVTLTLIFGGLLLAGIAIILALEHLVGAV